MKLKPLILFYGLLLAAPLGGRPKIDAIVMNNGDRFTSEIKRLESGVLYVGLDYVDGTISVDWLKVARVESAQLFLVTTQDGSIYRGSLKTPETPADRPVKIEVMEEDLKEIVLPQTQIVTLGQGSENFWHRFTGSINGGTIFAKSNNNTQYSLGMQLNYLQARFSASANYSSSFSFSEGSKTSTRNQLGLQGQHDLRWKNWFYAGIGNFLQSSEQGIQLQTTAGGGIGRFFKNTNRARISLAAGLAWQGTSYTQSTATLEQGYQNIIASYLSGGIQAFKFKKTKLDLVATLMPALSEPGRVRFNTNSTYAIQLINNLWLNFQFYGNWDNRPPVGFSGSDYGTSSGISWTFP
jgi:hypothetical protein